MKFLIPSLPSLSFRSIRAVLQGLIETSSWARLAAILFFTALAKFFAPVGALILGRAVSVSGASSGADAWSLGLMGLAFAFLLAKIMEALSAMLRAYVSIPVMERMNRHFLSKAHRALAASRPERLARPVGELAAQADAARQARNVFGFAFHSIIPAVFELAIGVIFIASQGLALAALGLALCAGLILALSLWAGPSLSEKSKRAALAQMSSMGSSADLIPSFLEAKALGREIEAQRLFDAATETEARLSVQSRKLDQTLDAGVMLCGGLGASLIFFLGAGSLSSGQISPGDFVASLSMATIALSPITSMGWAFREIASASAKLELALDLIETPPERPSGEDPAARAAPGTPLFLAKNLSVITPDGNVLLRDASFQIREGEKIALVGASGAGKTSLTKALLMMAPIQGRLECLGMDHARARPSDWRRLIGWTPQSPTPRMGTALDYLSMARPGLSAQEASEALSRSRLELDPTQPLGPGGRALSGGQWQRLALARSLLTPSKLLLLDEPSSALDAELEAQLMDRLLADSRATLAVTHRLGHARRFDSIWVMSEGRLIEQGSHEELLARGGLYAQLWAAAREGFMSG